MTRTYRRSRLAAPLCALMVSAASAPAFAERQEITPEQAAEIVQKAYELGSNPEDTELVLDVYIGFLSAAYPPLGAVAAGAKKLMDMLGFFDKPDAVGNMLKAINARIDWLDSEIKRLEKELGELKNELFKTQNLMRTETLRERNSDLRVIINDLMLKPTDPFNKANIAFRAKELANSFLKSESWHLWHWSDLHVYQDTKDGKYYMEVLPPDFKSLPVLETYIQSLVAWISAMEYAADGNYAQVKAMYGPEIQAHIDFLTVREGWMEVLPPHSKPDAKLLPAETLPEFIKSRVFCEVSMNEMYPKNGTCTVTDICHDAMGRKRWIVGSRDYTMPPGASMCNALQVSARTDVEEEVERGYGIEVIEAMLEKLKRLAKNGTAKEAYVGKFDMTFHHANALYGVRPNGELIWFKNYLSIDRNKPECKKDGLATSIYCGLGIPGLPKPEWIPKAIHDMSTPKLVGNGWNMFSQVLPAGGSGIYGLTPEGDMYWYKHEGSGDGSVKWKGPVKIGWGWNSYVKVFSNSDGVLYGIDGNGDLWWYKHLDHLDSAASPQWLGRTKVGNGGWNQFVHVFGGGKGIIYAVRPDGTLLWYRHKGSHDGSMAWEGWKEIGSGWAGFKKLMAVGDGQIYAVAQDGQVYSYIHEGHQDGSPKWLANTQIAADWSDFTEVFPLMNLSYVPGLH